MVAGQVGARSAEYQGMTRRSITVTVMLATMAPRAPSRVPVGIESDRGGKARMTLPPR
jgi:hypothetical protein